MTQASAMLVTGPLAPFFWTQIACMVLACVILFVQMCIRDRPGTDAALALGLAKIIEEEGKTDDAFMQMCIRDSSASDHKHDPESNTGAMPVTSSVSTLRMMPKLR